MSKQATELNFSNEVAYSEKVEIVIRLKAVLSVKEHKAVVDAAQTILTTTAKYLQTPPKPQEGNK